MCNKEKEGNRKLMKKLNYYFDMDGVLADFNAENNAVERYAIEKGFFKNLQPMSFLQTAKRLIKNNYNVSVISASPNDQADSDKMVWLEKYLPELPKEKIHLVRVGQNKSKALNRELTINDILFDDYSKNCLEWREAGGRSVKVG